MTELKLPQWPWNLVQGLADARSIRLWLVGGAVRDLLLRRPVHDWDFAVDDAAMTLARAVADVLDGYFFPLDDERGTARVVLKDGRESPVDLDFARLRGDSLRADLRARDFTINAMAVGAKGQLVDPLGGQTDLARRCIRGTRRTVFADDPVRLLRAVRLERELDFQLDDRSEGWVQADAERLAGAAAERVRDELVRGLAVPAASRFIERLDGLGLLSSVLPEVVRLQGVDQSHPHRFDVWRHTLGVLDNIDGVVATMTGEPLPAGSTSVAEIPAAAWGDLVRRTGQFAGFVRDHLAVAETAGRDRLLLLRLAALLHDVGKPQTQSQDDTRIRFHGHETRGRREVTHRLRALRFSRGEVSRVGRIVEAHLRPAQLAREDRTTRRAVYRYFRDTGDAGVDTVLLSLADHLATWGPNLRESRWSRRLDIAELMLFHYFERSEETVDPQLPVDGHDLMRALDLEPGPEIGRLLDLLLEAAAAGDIGTREEAIALARESVRCPQTAPTE